MTSKIEQLKKEIDSLKHQGEVWKNQLEFYERCEECEDLLPETEIQKVNLQIGALKKGYELGRTEQKAEDIEEELRFLESLVNENMCGEEDGNETTEIKRILNRIRQLKSKEQTTE